MLESILFDRAHALPTGPLSGVVVLDFGQAAVGPVAASYMSMLGATVIKVESPTGDTTRYPGHGPSIRGRGTTFLGNNIGKFGVVVDLKTERGLEEALRLVRIADVVIDNFRGPQVMSRLGLDYFSVLRKVNPGLVYLQASAFGAVGPSAGMVSFEWMSQACSGFVGGTGSPEGGPEFSRGTAYLDWNGAMLNVVAMLTGLYARSRRGRGLMLETSQFGSSVYTALTRIHERPTEPALYGSGRSGIVPDRVYATADGYVAVSAPEEATWRRLCEAVSRSDLVDEPLLTSNQGRCEQRELVDGLLGEALSKYSTGYWIERLRMFRVPCAAHRWGISISEILLSNPQVAANDMMTVESSSFGRLVTQTPHWRFDRLEASIRRRAPRLGEHDELVRALAPLTEDGAGSSPANSDIDIVRSRSRSPLSDCMPLKGARVLEIGSGLSLSVAGMVLADLGAEVTKVEGPKGDPLHNWNSARDSELWNVLTQKKKMVALDLPAQSGVERLRELVCAGPDLVLASGTPETRRDLSYDHETIRAWAPAVDYCGITGWGDTGDLSEQPATELSVQVAAGMTLHLGEPGHEPIRQGFDLVTMNTGYAAVQAGLSLMLHRMRDSSDRTGEHVEVSMMHTAVALSQWNLAAESCPDEKIGKQLEGYEWEPDHGYVCRDARFYVSFRSDEEAWTRFLIALDRVDLLADSRFSTVKLLRRNERFLPALLVGRLSKWSYSDLERLVRDELGGSIVRIRAPRELPEDPQVAALKFVRPGDSTVPLTMTAPILEVSEL